MGDGLYVEVKIVAILGKKVKTNDVFTGRTRSGRVGEVMGKGQDVGASRRRTPIFGWIHEVLLLSFCHDNKPQLVFRLRPVMGSLI